MSTFLKLAQDYAREARFAQLSASISTVIGQTGRNLEAVEAIKEAYIDIQNRYFNWRWMEHRFSLQTVADTGTYAYTDATDEATASAIDRFSHWIFDDMQPLTVYLTSGGVGSEHDLVAIDWDSFRWLYRRGTQNAQYPQHYSIDPQNNLVFGPIPNGIYTISGSYQRGPQLLELDADVPDMPAQYHNLIWAYALEIYGLNHAANNILVKSARLAKRRMRQLEGNQLPAIPTAGPMV